MSEKDKIAYWKLKADPERYRVYLDRKRQERRNQQVNRGYETERKQRWRAANRAKVRLQRQAMNAVEVALRNGKFVRPEQCSACPTVGKIEAHHHKGYAPEFWLDVQWLCVMCHRKADREQEL